MNRSIDFLSPALCGALTAALLATTSPTQADPKRPPLDPAVTALLDKMAAGRGPATAGKDTAITIEGDYAVTFGKQTEPVAKGTFRDLFVGSDLARHTSAMGDLGSMEKGLHNGIAWEVDPSMGAKVLRGENAAAMRRQFALVRGDDPRRVYREIEKTGTQALDGRTVNVLQMTAIEGKPDVWYVDADGTLVRVDIALPVPESADGALGMGDLLASELTFADWQKVDGGRFPMRRTLRMGQATVSLTCKTVQVGAPIDVAKFQPPAAVAKVKLDPVEPAFGADGKPTYQVVARQAQPVASIRVKVKPAEISTTLGVLLPEVMQHLTAVGAKMAGPPFSRYHAVSETEIDLEAGMPIQQPFEAKGRVTNSALPAGKALTVWHIGPYDTLGQAHEALRAQVNARKLKARGGQWEIYWTDPGMVPDPAKWKTQLFAPID